MDRRPAAIGVLTATLLLLPLVLGAVAQAEQTRLGGKVRAGSQVVIPEDETVPGNVYVAAGDIRVEGDVEGDLVAAGGRVQLLGTVGGDMLVAGGDVRVPGTVLGDARIASGQTTVTGLIEGDAAIAAGRARIDSAAEIGEDLLFTTGQMQMDGAVAGDVAGQAGEYAEEGSVAGTREIEVAPAPEPPTAAERTLDAVQRYAALLVVGAVLLWLAPRLLRRGEASIRREPLLVLGVGALTLLGTGAAILALLVVAGILAGLLGLLGLGSLAAAVFLGAMLVAAALAFAVVVLSVFAAPVLVGLWLGRLAIPDDGRWPRSFGALALGTLAIVVARALPVLGAVVLLAVVLFGLGALALLAFRRLRLGVRPPQQVPAPPSLPVLEPQR